MCLRYFSVPVPPSHPYFNIGQGAMGIPSAYNPAGINIDSIVRSMVPGLSSFEIVPSIGYQLM
jgi:hypothetical protein